MNNERRKRQRFTRWVKAMVKKYGLIVMTVEKQAGLTNGCLHNAFERESAMNSLTVEAVKPVIEKMTGEKYQ